MVIIIKIKIVRIAELSLTNRYRKMHYICIWLMNIVHPEWDRSQCHHIEILEKLDFTN